MRAMFMTILTFILILPAAFAEDTFDYSTCAQYDAIDLAQYDTAELIDAIISHSDANRVDAAIKENLNESPHVIICMIYVGKSSGHGPFGLLTWDQRKIATADALKLSDDLYAVANVVARTELKAPLGYWQVEQISRIEGVEMTENFNQTLTTIWEEVLEEHPGDVNFTLYKSE